MFATTPGSRFWQRVVGLQELLAASGILGSGQTERWYEVPAGPIGAAVKKVTGDDAHQRAQDDLRRFKELVETGEIARSEGAPTSRT